MNTYKKTMMMMIRVITPSNYNHLTSTARNKIHRRNVLESHVSRKGISEILVRPRQSGTRLVLEDSIRRMAQRLGRWASELTYTTKSSAFCLLFSAPPRHYVHTVTLLLYATL